MAGLKHPVTPDGRYFVVRGRLWRLADPAIDPARKAALVHDLVAARRAIKDAKCVGDSGSDVKNEMRRYKKGTAKSGPGGKGGKVKSRKQAIAIGLSKARKKGKKVPKKKSSR